MGTERNFGGNGWVWNGSSAGMGGDGRETGRGRAGIEITSAGREVEIGVVSVRVQLWDRALTVVVWNVGVDVVADEQLNDIVAVHFAGVAEGRASDVVAGVHVSSARQQQLRRRHSRFLFLRTPQTYTYKSCRYRNIGERTLSVSALGAAGGTETESTY